MMSQQFDKLHQFFHQFKSLSFFKRLFGWRAIKLLSYDAYEEFKSAQSALNDFEQENEKYKNELKYVAQENKNIKDQLAAQKESNIKQESKIQHLEEEKAELSRQINKLSEKITRYEQTEASRKEEYEKNVTKLNSIREGLEKDQQRLQEEREEEIRLHYEQMKATWSAHETNVEQAIRGICQKQIIEYLEEVPFRGRPDNAIRIADEIVIFDAKSPAGENLDNFPTYLRNQTEQAQKYAKQEGVKKDIFLVIPSNTVERIKQFAYNMGDYNVYVVTIDALEPIIMALKRIEDYEFAEQLSPEERENVCRIIGKFSHTSKRRIQIDMFFAYQYLDLLTKSQSDIPPEFRNMVEAFEKAEKLNPSVEKRTKNIPIEDLAEGMERLLMEARAKQITEEGNNDKDHSQ